VGDEPIRRLGDVDVPALVALGASLDWNGEERRYRLLLAVGEIYGIDDPRGDGLIGTVTLTRFGAQLASVGMMLVHPAHGGRGHGRSLMEHAMSTADEATVALFATSARALVGDLAAGADGPVRIEVGVGRHELGHWAIDRGLDQVSTTSLMTLGGRDVPGDRRRSFTPVTLALG
jgi:GNAT superfamily N-acetyltransferase